MNNFTNPFFHPYRVYSMPQMYSYGYPPIYFEQVDRLDKKIDNNKSQEDLKKQENWNSRNEVIDEPKSGFRFNDIISVDEDRISVLGFSINIDDLIILITLFTMFKSGEKIDYTLVIVLGLLLFTQD